MEIFETLLGGVFCGLFVSGLLITFVFCFEKSDEAVRKRMYQEFIDGLNDKK